MLFKLWYVRASIGLLVGAVFLLISLALLLEIGPPDLSLIFVVTLLVLFLTLMLFAFLCLGCLCPYYASGDKSLNFKYTPRRTIRELNLTNWTMPIASIGIGVLLVLAPLLDEVFIKTGWIGNTEQQVGFGCLIAGVVTIPPSFWVSKKLRPRMIEMTRRRLICFECGYDLRNIEHATTCPECGDAVPRVNQEKPIATAPTQDPAHPDRS